MKARKFKSNYTLQITCVFGAYLKEEWVRVIEVADSTTLANLHIALQAELKFDDDHLFGFFVGRPRSTKIEWLNSNEDPDQAYDYYSSTLLRDALPTDGRRLHYLFDF